MCDDTHSIHISPSDPGWVGAWWIGFLISAVGSLIATILSVFFPPDLPGRHQPISSTYSKNHGIFISSQEVLLLERINIQKHTLGRVRKR